MKGSRRHGSSGSPPSANECPLGRDPVRYCDVQTRKPALDPRFYVCIVCGKQGRIQNRQDGQEATPTTA